MSTYPHIQSPLNPKTHRDSLVEQSSTSLLSYEDIPILLEDFKKNLPNIITLKVSANSPQTPSFLLLIISRLILCFRDLNTKSIQEGRLSQLNNSKILLAYISKYCEYFQEWNLTILDQGVKNITLCQADFIHMYHLAETLEFNLLA